MGTNKRSLSERIFRMVLRALPFDFRTDYGPEMEQVFRDQHGEAREQGGIMGLFRLWWDTFLGIFRTAPRQHWDMLKQDGAYAIRMMGRNPVFTAVCVLTLALGIGANTAIFSVVHSVLLNPLPYRQGGQLIHIRQQEQKAGNENMRFSVHEIEDYRQMNSTLAGVVEYHGMRFTLFGHGDPERVRTGVVSWNYFDLFGVKPILGRTFRPDDEKLGAPAVLVLSYEYWRSSFNGDPQIVGKTFTMNDKVHTVVGVLPPVPQYPNENDVYMPTSACPFRSSKQMIEGRDQRMMEVFARMKPDASLRATRADLSIVANRLEAEYPKFYPESMGYSAVAAPLREELTRRAQPTLLVLFAAAGFVLLIACANVANLTLSRMARRERELTVRAALGAGRSRMLRQLLTENLLVAFLGGGLGLLLAYQSLPLLAEFAARLTPRAREIHVDVAVLLFTLAVAVGTSILFGSVFAFSSREDMASGLKEGSTAATSGRRKNRLRSALLVSQVAFSFMLLIGAGLMLRSLLKLQETDAGFVPQRVLTMRINLNWSKYTADAQVVSVSRRLLDKVQSYPGVLSASLSSGMPLDPERIGQSPFQGNYMIEGRLSRPGEPTPRALLRIATPDYFKTLGIRLLEGRTFNDADNETAPQVAVINQTMAQHQWPQEDPIGKRISFDKGDHWVTIIGIVADVHELGLDRSPVDEAFGPMAQNPALSSLLVRTSGDPLSMARQLGQAVHDVDPETAITSVVSLEQARTDSMTSPRVTTDLLALFAGLALLIAVAGIGGIMAFSVSQRVHEIGIRMTLGAAPESILRMILGQSMRLVLIGAGLGLAGALAMTGLLRTMLFEVTPTDPFTYAGVILILIGAAMLASYIPARRAAGIDPMVALRFE
jgi:putative ABC transport system permease protein